MIKSICKNCVGKDIGRLIVTGCLSFGKIVKSGLGKGNIDQMKDWEFLIWKL